METDPRRRLGRRIATLRADRGLTQEQLAARAGIARSYVASVEQGGRNVAVVNLTRIAAALDVRVAELFPD
jgi:transcriptional regulator with XRE-family HTH domain